MTDNKQEMREGSFYIVNEHEEYLLVTITAPLQELPDRVKDFSSTYLPHFSHPDFPGIWKLADDKLFISSPPVEFSINIRFSSPPFMVEQATHPKHELTFQGKLSKTISVPCDGPVGAMSEETLKNWETLYNEKYPKEGREP